MPRLAATPIPNSMEGRRWAGVEHAVTFHHLLNSAVWCGLLVRSRARSQHENVPCDGCSGNAFSWLSHTNADFVTRLAFASPKSWT